MVTVHIQLGYDTGDRLTPAELTARIPELQDFVRQFFQARTAAQLAPAYQDSLKSQIIEYLNTRLLSESKVRICVFSVLNVTNM
jgi:flagellar basal body-associated protein FliL